MKKLLVTLGLILGIVFSVNIASANLRQTAINSNNPDDLVKYLNTTKTGKRLNITKAKYTSNNYLVLVFKSKPKIKTESQRERLAANLQYTMNNVPKSFIKSGIAFFNGNSDGANMIIAFSSKKISKNNYYSNVKKDSLKDFSQGATAFYIEPNFSEQSDGMISSDPDTQGPTSGPDGETLIEVIQDAVE